MTKVSREAIIGSRLADILAQQEQLMNEDRKAGRAPDPKDFLANYQWRDRTRKTAEEIILAEENEGRTD